MKIVECGFVVEKCNNQTGLKQGGYKIHIYFYADAAKTKLVSEKKLTITKDGQRLHSTKPVYDIYSFNASSSSRIKTLLNDKNFSSKTLEECRETIRVYDTLDHDLMPQVLFVLDVKNFPGHENDCSYTHQGSISTSENNILDFIRFGNESGGPNANTFRNLLLSIHLRYVILEGSLKAAFISDGFLSEDEKSFLQTRGNGNKNFCQLIEFFLTAFKRGEMVTTKKLNKSKTDYHRDSYLKKISDTEPDYTPTDISETIYPSPYHDIAINGSYTSSMKRSTLFDINNREHAGQVVQMTTKPKGVA